MFKFKQYQKTDNLRNKKMEANSTIKNVLQEKNWSYRKAAVVLGVHYVYLNRVANGHFTSQRLSEKVENLPSYDFFMQANPNFFHNKKQRKIR